jgi:hypothetical protein
LYDFGEDFSLRVTIGVYKPNVAQVRLVLSRQRVKR